MGCHDSGKCIALGGNARVCKLLNEHLSEQSALLLLFGGWGWWCFGH